jgi:hypothetical protein
LETKNWEFGKMKSTLRMVALGAALMFTGTAHAALVQLNFGSDADIAAGNVQSAMALGTVNIGADLNGSGIQIPGQGNGVLDIGNGGLVVDAANFTFACPTPSGGVLVETGTTAVSDAIANMIGDTLSTGASPNGLNGIMSSSQAAQNNGGTFGIGWAQDTPFDPSNPNNPNAQYGAYGYTNFRGVNPLAHGFTDPVMIGYTYAGDIFMEGTLSGTDYSVISGNADTGIPGANWVGGDTFYDGEPNGTDVSVVSGMVDTGVAGLYPDPEFTDTVGSGSGSPVSAPSALAVSAVPEPGSLSLILVFAFSASLVVWKKYAR